MLILSIDLGKFNSMICFFDSQSNQARFQAIKTEREYLRYYVKHKVAVQAKRIASALGTHLGTYGDSAEDGAQLAESEQLEK